MRTLSSVIVSIATVVVLDVLASPQVERQPAPATTQAQDRFEVASIARSRDSETQRAPMGLSSGRFEMQNMPVRSLLAFAFRVKANEIASLPSWATTERYTIRAKSEIERPSSEQLRRMVQDLLRTRFQFVSHEEQRQVDVFALVPARSDGKRGPRLMSRAEPCQPDKLETVKGMPQAAGRQLPCPGFLTGPTWLYAAGLRLPAFAELLSNAMLGGTRVVDRSQLDEVFDISLEYSPLGAAGEPPDPLGPAHLMAALQDQLGLKLEPARELVNVFVVDRLERPTEN